VRSFPIPGSYALVLRPSETPCSAAEKAQQPPCHLGDTPRPVDQPAAWRMSERPGLGSCGQVHPFRAGSTGPLAAEPTTSPHPSTMDMKWLWPELKRQVRALITGAPPGLEPRTRGLRERTCQYRIGPSGIVRCRFLLPRNGYRAVRLPSGAGGCRRVPELPSTHPRAQPAVPTVTVGVGGAVGGTLTIVSTPIGVTLGPPASSMLASHRAARSDSRWRWRGTFVVKAVAGRRRRGRAALAQRSVDPAIWSPRPPRRAPRAGVRGPRR
jgi:hypothetical protein